MGSLISVGQSVISYIVGEEENEPNAPMIDDGHANPTHFYGNPPPFQYKAYKPGEMNPPHYVTPAKYQYPRHVEGNSNYYSPPNPNPAFISPPPQPHVQRPRPPLPPPPLPPPPLPPPALPPPPLPPPPLELKDTFGDEISHSGTTNESKDCSENAAPVGEGDSHSVAAFPSISLSELQLERVLGGGGFGQVWQGMWCGTPVAVKILSLPQSLDKLGKEQSSFQAEVALLASMRHPNICLLIGVCVEGTNAAIVTELVPKGSLWDVLHNNGRQTSEGQSPLSKELQFRVLSDTCRGLAYLHHRTPPVLHRDLKSANLLVDEAFHIKICDFGLARLRDMSTSIMTAQVGTVQWMAPEIIRGESYSESADIYSLAVVMWEVLTGLCPYDGMNVMDIVQRVGGSGVLINTSTNTFRPDVSRLQCSALQLELIRDCWSQNPSMRPSATEVLKRLEVVWQ